MNGICVRVTVIPLHDSWGRGYYRCLPFKGQETEARTNSGVIPGSVAPERLIRTRASCGLMPRLFSFSNAGALQPPFRSSYEGIMVDCMAPCHRLSWGPLIMPVNCLDILSAVALAKQAQMQRFRLRGLWAKARPGATPDTGLHHLPWQPSTSGAQDSPGKITGVGCHFLLQCIKVKSESEVAQSYPTFIRELLTEPLRIQGYCGVGRGLSGHH